jgi:hypothetical protein
MKKKKIISFLLLPLVIFGIFFSFYLRNFQQPPISYWDEVLWVSRGYHFELFVNRDFNNPLWENYNSYDQPKLAEYFFGAVIFPKYLEAKRAIGKIDYDYITFLTDHNLYPFGFGKGANRYKNYKDKQTGYITLRGGDSGTPEVLGLKYGEGIFKTIDLIYTARRANVILLALSVVVVYFLARTIFGTEVAVLSVLFYGFNNLIVYYGLMAHSEALFLLLFNLGLLLLVLRFGKKKKCFKIFIPFSVVAALCTATKLNGLMLIIFFNIFILFEIITLCVKEDFLAAGKSFSQLLLVNLLSFAIFVSLHPFLYKNPLQETIFLYTYRGNQTQRLTRIFSEVHLPNFPNRIITMYKKFFIKGDIIRETPPVYLMKFPLFLLGIGVLLMKALERKAKNREIKIVLVLFIMVQITMGLYLLLDWDRYYVPLAPFFALFQAVGVWWLIKLMGLPFLKIFKK